MTDARRNTAVMACLFGLITACAAQRDVLVQLETHRPQAYDPRQIEVQATVLGPQTGLRYKWFSVDGDFDPQQSYEPKTQFTFAANAARDRIWVEVWRDNDKVAESALDVNVDTQPHASRETAPVPELTVTRIPRYDPAGGPDTRDTIAGIVRTPVASDYRVIVYARADAWYIQPTPFAMQPINADNKWQTWTHTGSSYAALVVRSTYKPLTRLDVLPQVDADVLARAIVDGRK
ncbi:MAG TPA: hypothetical protein VF105_13675 [Gemmatimonadaceae bacterium]